MTAPALATPALPAAPSRARSAERSSTERLGLPVLVVGDALRAAGYAALGLWLLQAVLGLFA